MPYLRVFLHTAIVGLFFVIFAFPVQSQSNDRAWVQVFSRNNLSEARDIARYMRDDIGWDKTRIFLSENGWYSIVIGAIDTREEYLLTKWKRERYIPQDSLLTQGRRFVREYEIDTAQSKNPGLTSGEAALGLLMLGLIGNSLLGGGSNSGSGYSNTQPDCELFVTSSGRTVRKCR